MTIDEFLQQLYGEELSDMFAGNRNSKIESRPKLIPLINVGLQYAYAKYKLDYDSLLLSVSEGVTEYVLDAEDILQVIQVINVYGQELPSTEYQVLGQRIYFPFPRTQELEVVYKTKPEMLSVTQDDEDTVLELPDALIPWLKAFVCYRYFASMANETGAAKAAHFFTLALAAEEFYVNTNTTNEFTAPTTDKMSARGFC